MRVFLSQGKQGMMVMVIDEIRIPDLNISLPVITQVNLTHSRTSWHLY